MDNQYVRNKLSIEKTDIISYICKMENKRIEKEFNSFKVFNIHKF